MTPQQPRGSRSASPEDALYDPPRLSVPAGRDLFRNPLCTAEDLGKPIPDSPDACSVALPLWDHAVGYEEQRADVLDRMECGYPRFFFHPQVSELMAAAADRFGKSGTASYVFPSRRSAERCRDYVAAKHGVTPEPAAFKACGIHVVTCPEQFSATCKAFWQHTGLIVSSRRARAALRNEPDRADEGETARRVLRQRIAELYGASAEDVLLFPSGMAAIFAANELASRLHPGRRRIQLEFPFLDTLKVQQEFAGEVALYTTGNHSCDGIIRAIAGGDPVGAVMTEVPSNPLLRTVDFDRIMPAVRDQGALLIVDDTAATPINVDVTGHADIIVTSLTKFFCGHGDAVAGALVINPRSAHHDRLHRTAHQDHEDLLWWEDAVVLEERSRDFEARVRCINGTAEALADFLHAHPAVDQVYYPKFDTSPGYENLRIPRGGYGGLVSILLRDAPRTTPAFFDRLRVNKGPGLGTNYTLACPYTILAHYHELDWAESHGVSRWLIRVSVGMEDPAEMQARFEAALAEIS